MVTFCSLPVALSLAFTLMMPFASISKVTSIWGIPRCAGGIPSRRKRPSDILSPAIGRSPCKTWMSTAVWLSAAVEYTSVLRTGMVVLRSIITVMTLPIVSTPKESGVTSRSRISFTSPLKTPAWIAAPIATTSSGLTPLCGSLPPVSPRTKSWIIGIRLEPPTKTTSFSSLAFIPASFNAASKGVLQRLTKSPVICSNLARVNFSCKCFGPEASAVT